MRLTEPSLGRARQLVRRLALGATLIGGIWVIGIVVTGGFAIRIGGRAFSSREPIRPLYWTLLPLALFVLANGVEQTARAWSSWIARIDRHRRAAAAALALATLALGATFATTVANGSDAYGYVSQADLWLGSDLRIPQPWMADVPWPTAALTFSPLAYRPAGTGNPTDLVPVYPPGYPLLMAAAKAVGGQRAMFLITPLAGAMLVLTTYGIGRRWGAPGAGLIAALFVATSPAFLFMLMLPFSDVPAAACCTLALYLLLRPGIAAGIGAGLSAGLAILIRPQLLLLAGPPALWLLWQTFRPARPSRGVEAARLIGFSIGVIGAVVFIGVVNARLHGSPWRSGYGDLGPLFGWSNVAINIRQYLGWLVESQTPLILVGLAAVVWPARSLWPRAGDRTFFLVVGACVVALWSLYCFYLPFDAWWFLRFLLASWPFIMLGLAAVIVTHAQRGAATFVVCAVVVAVLGIRQLNDSRLRGAFDLWRGDRETVAAALATRDAIPPRSVVLADLFSGSVRYYGGRMTMEYVWLDGEWLDRAVAWLDTRRVPSYALLLPAEARDFRVRFRGSATVARLDAPPIFVYPEDGLALYALSAPFEGPTRTQTFDPGQLRSVSPAPLVPFGVR